jgi:hypothetical protein
MANILVYVSQSFAVRPDGRRGKALHKRIRVQCNELEVGRCERAVTLINNNYVRMGKGQFVRIDTSRSKRIDARNLYVRCSVWNLAGHQDAVVNPELDELVSRLIHKLSSMGEEHDLPPLLNRTFYDLRGDDCFASASGSVQDDAPVAS